MVKNSHANAGDIRDADLIPGLGRHPGRDVATHSLPGESHGQRSLAGYIRGSRSNMTKAF